MQGKFTFDIRVAVCFFFIMLGFLSCVLRVAVITSGNYSAVQTEQSSYRLEIGSIRGTIFDTNKISLTNSQSSIIAAVIPNSVSAEWLLDAVDPDERENVSNKLNGSAPFVTEITHNIELDGVATTTYYNHTLNEKSLCHIIGYVGNDLHGISGLEKAYDDLLYSKDGASAIFKINGRGEVLKGEEITIENDTKKIASGVVSTIDINIQTALDEATADMEKGAAIVIEPKSGKIRGMISRPYFDIENVATYFERDDSPLINRCLSAYNVGSVFKPCVAAAALEAGTNDYYTDCKGYETIADRKFACHKREGHGIVDLFGAIGQSCNVFFYNLAAEIGAEKIYNMASSLGFGNSLKLSEGIFSVSGNLTDLSLLENSAELANLSIGQGKLLLSPVSVISLYCAIANGGCYVLPSITEGILTEGAFTANQPIAPTRVMSDGTAKKLTEFLKGVVTDGTGTAANPKNTTAAGKTATAQTGRYKNGIEITHSWFCGFFPAESPRYAVCVMVEEGGGSAEIFSKIADGIIEKGF